MALQEGTASEVTNHPPHATTSRSHVEQGRQDAPSATATTRRDEEAGTSDNEKRFNLDELAQELQQSLAMERRRYKRVVHTFWVVCVIFLLIWIVGLPLAIAYVEDWTYQAAWYFSIQAGFGVGYGALTVRTAGMEVFLAIHLFLGAISISFLIAHLIERGINAAAEKKKSQASMLEEYLGQTSIGWKSWIVGAVLLLTIMAAGILYGMLYEKWNFTESLYFIVSTCQSSGLLAPTIRPKDPNNLFAPLFVSFLVVLAVPLWAYNIGKMAVELVNLDRAQRRQTSVMKRSQESQEAFFRLAPSMGIDVSDPANAQVNLAGYIVQWLLFDRIVNESTIQDVIAEYHVESEGDDKAIPQWKLIAWVRFLQLLQLNLVQSDDWDDFCQEARKYDKNDDMNGRSTASSFFLHTSHGGKHINTSTVKESKSE